MNSVKKFIAVNKTSQNVCIQHMSSADCEDVHWDVDCLVLVISCILDVRVWWW